MLKWLFACLAAIFLGGLVHVIGVISLPYLADTGLAVQIGNARLAANRFYIEEELRDRSISIGQRDPNIRIALCPLELSQGPVSVYAPLFSGYWSLSIFDQELNNVAVFNKSSFLGNASEVVIGTSARDALLASDETIISVILPDFTGYALLRLMPGFAHEAAEAREVLNAARCSLWQVR